MVVRRIFAIFCGILEYLCIPLCLSEPQSAFCETLKFHGIQFEKHCFKGFDNDSIEIRRLLKSGEMKGTTHFGIICRAVF